MFGHYGAMGEPDNGGCGKTGRFGQNIHPNG
jgi:hypothetical protein